MAISRNFLLDNLSGQLGKQIVLKKYGERTVVSRYPDMSRRKLSPKQKRINEMMEDAHWAAKEVMADEELRMAALWRLNVTRSKLYTSLIQEYFKDHKDDAVVVKGKKKARR